jgi:hypothetical protein
MVIASLGGLVGWGQLRCSGRLTGQLLILRLMTRGSCTILDPDAAPGSESHAVAREALADAAAEAAAPAPRSNRIAHSLRRVTDTLTDAGVLASAASGVVNALASAVSLVALLA